MGVHVGWGSAHGGDGVSRGLEGDAQDSQPARVEEPEHARDVGRRHVLGRGPGPQRSVRRKGSGSGPAAARDAGRGQCRLRCRGRARGRSADYARKSAQGPEAQSQGRRAALRADRVPGHRLARAVARAAAVGGRGWERSRGSEGRAGDGRGDSRDATGAAALMLRLPSFTYLQPQSLPEALRMKQDAGPQGAYVAGGTDLYPNMKRRHQEPKTVISLRGVRDLSGDGKRERGNVVPAGITLSALAADSGMRKHYAAVAAAAELVSTPLLRNMGTLGGNLCLDTRCNYYNQGYEWRKAIDFCMKKDGAICWVAPSSPRCCAVSSSDLAPVLVALGAEYVLAGPQGERVVPAARFYHNDGINYLTKQPAEIFPPPPPPPPAAPDPAHPNPPP